MKKIIYAIGLISLSLFSCDLDDEKVTLPTTEISGDYVLTIKEPGEDPEEGVHILVFNTANSDDSLWVEVPHHEQIKVKWDGANSFSVTESYDTSGEALLNVTGQAFPEKDSIHIEWYSIEDDELITGDGILYNGLTN